MHNRSFFRHAVLYGLSGALVQAGGVVLAPLLTRCLSMADYGALEVVQRCAELAGMLFLIGGLRQGLLTFHQQSKTDVERQRVFRATLVLLLGVCLLGGALIMAIAGPFCNIIRPEHGAPIETNVLRLAVLAVLLEPLSLMPMALLQARLESPMFVAVTASQLVVRVALTVVLTVVLPWGVMGVLTATAVTTGTYGVVLSLRELLRGGLCLPKLDQVRGLVRFAVPMLPVGLCFFILQNGDRFFLLRWCGPAEVGVYSLGYKVALAVSTFSLAPLYMVWSARMYKAAEAPDAPRVFGRVFTRILGAFLLVGLAAALFQDEAAAVLGGAKYAGAAAIVAPVVLAGFFQSAAALMDSGFYVRRRTDLKLWITLAATAVILVLYIVLIPLYGAMGAAFATVAGFAFLAAGTWWATQRIFRVQYEWSRLLDLLGLAAGLWLVSRFLPAAPWTVAARAGLWLLWPLLVWVCGLPTAEEKKYVFAAVRQALKRLRHRTMRSTERKAPAEAA
ncbi:MAG TPA: lipopolysaccharide biosynthesis protein [Gemmataceae bacterium]|nr:lipopolysaccharide biosynthesis protein [Gemmataceae bacterium]